MDFIFAVALDITRFSTFHVAGNGRHIHHHAECSRSTTVPIRGGNPSPRQFPSCLLIGCLCVTIRSPIRDLKHALDLIEA